LNFGTIWKSDWLVAVMLTLLFLIACESDFLPLRYFDDLVYDQISDHTELTADKQIILVDMDEKALSDAGGEQGGEAMASVIARLSEAGARVIGLGISYSHVASDSDQPLVEAVRRSGNTLMPMFIDVGLEPESLNAVLPNDLRHLIIKHVNHTDIDASPVQAVSLRYPYAQLIQASAGIGQMNVFADHDGIVRSEPLAIRYAGKFFPSMPLALAAKVLHIPLNDIRISLGLDIELGAHNIETDTTLRMYPTFYAAPGGNSFTSYAFRDVLSGHVSADSFRHKIVLIGSAEKSISTPTRMMSRIEFTAHVLQSVLSDQYNHRPAWIHLLELGLIILIGIYLTFLWQRLSAVMVLLVSGLLLLALISVEFIMLIGYALWVQTIAAALLLFFGHVLLGLKQAYTNQNQQKKSTDSLTHLRHPKPKNSQNHRR